jgi:hypothetical protein
MCNPPGLSSLHALLPSPFNWPLLDSALQHRLGSRVLYPPLPHPLCLGGMLPAGRRQLHTVCVNVHGPWPNPVAAPLYL